MTRNVIIGVLVVAVVVLGGFYIMKNKTLVDVNTTVTPASPVAKTPPSSPVTSPKPGAPVVVTVANPAVSNSTAIVTGQVKPNGATTNYWFEYGETTALGTRTTSQQIGSGYFLLSTPAFITGLKANTTYYYRLSSSNSFATVNGSTLTLQTNSNPPPTGKAPTVQSNSASDVTRNGASVNGAVNPNGWQTNFWFEYGTDTNLGNATEVVSAGNGVTAVLHSASLSNLQPSTKYYFRVNAQNQFGTVIGSTLNFTTQGPVAVTAPSATTTSASNVTSTGARMNGRINPNGVETNYWFEYSQDTLLGALLGGGSSIKTLSAGSSNVDVDQDLTGLAKNTTYYYRVVGRNSAGTTQGSIVSFKTKN